MVELFCENFINKSCVAGNGFERDALFVCFALGEFNIFVRKVKQRDIAAFMRKVKRISPGAAADIKNFFSRFYISVDKAASQQEFRRLSIRAHSASTPLL
jgi:hypothetical protein